MSNIINKVCEYCGKDFLIDYRMREQKFCSVRCASDNKSIKKTYTLLCEKCNTEYEVCVSENLFNKSKYKKNCSRKCANSKTWSDEHKKRLSETCKNSDKVKIANKQNAVDKKIKSLSKNINLPKIGLEFICEHCGKIGNNRCGKTKQRYHKDCWMSISGGVKKGSSRGKCGWYKGYWCDSSYELVFVIYNLEHDNKIERNNKSYEYSFNDKKHLYYPDFRVNGKLIEIKNYRSELTDIKLKSVDEEIDIYYKDTIKPFMDYVINKYGKKFIELYEK